LLWSLCSCGLLVDQEPKQYEQYSALLFVGALGQCRAVKLQVLIADKILHDTSPLLDQAGALPSSQSPENADGNKVMFNFEHM
jgi:hypothetical protein